MSDFKSSVLAKEFSRLMEKNRSKSICWSIYGYSRPYKNFDLLKIKELLKELEEVKK